LAIVSSVLNRFGLSSGRAGDQTKDDPMFDNKFVALGPLALAAAVVSAAVVAPSLPGGSARAASFDCARAGNPTEVAICADPSLSALDSAMAAAYAQRLAQDPSVRQIQRAWLAARNTCGGRTDCLTPLITAQLAWLRGGAPRPSGALPTREGACALTSVKQVMTRLQDGQTGQQIPGSGSAVQEADGGYQVSYDTIPAIQASRRGDPVLVCLVSIPQGCPPGDNRGRSYAVGNLRTLGAWSAPDAEHMCGGA
jgi:uncharacterized protein